MKFREVEKMILDDGWTLRETKGSHKQYTHPEKQGRVTIPFKRGDIPIGTIKSIKRQAGLK